jgi:hypothetical protein
VRPNFTVNSRPPLRLLHAAQRGDNRIVKFNIDTGVIDPQTTPLLTMKKNNVQPRVSMTFSPASKTVIRGGVGVFVGPGQTEDQIQPIESERINTTLTSGPLLAFPARRIADPAELHQQPEKPLVPAAALLERLLDSGSGSISTRPSIQQELPGNMAATVGLHRQSGPQPVPRSIANRTIDVHSNGRRGGHPDREFDIVTRKADGTIRTINRPYAEIDYKTSGGHDSYNSLQLSLTGARPAGDNERAVRAGYSKGNTGGSKRSDTCRSITPGRSADFDYDNGYNNFDVRHTFNLSVLYSVPGSGALTGGWIVGAIANARSGLPVPVLIGRNDVVYVDGAGDRLEQRGRPAGPAVINTPGGGASRSTRRPDLVPGVDPFIQSGGLLFLNPAAFATPAPGTFGNLERNSIHGPGTKQIDMVIAKRIGVGRGPNVELRAEIFNLFNQDNFANPVGTLPNALPTGNAGTAPAANTVQPGQAYSSAAAGTFGRLTSTVGTTVGLGTNRQVQFAMRVNF